jgi:hypothetical protein
MHYLLSSLHLNKNDMNLPQTALQDNPDCNRVLLERKSVETRLYLQNENEFGYLAFVCKSPTVPSGAGFSIKEIRSNLQEHYLAVFDAQQ